jgi:hypothetical protein
MQKSLSVAVFLFGLSLGAQAEAGDNKFQSRDLPDNIRSQTLAVADMAPSSIPDVPQDLPNAVVTSNLGSNNIDAAKLVPKTAALAQIQPANNNAPQAAPSGNSSGQTHAQAVSAAQQAQLKNYAPFMRNMMMAAMTNGGGMPKNIKAARVMHGGKQVIVLGMP